MGAILFCPIVGLIHNTKDDRYHPVVFREAPLPGGDGPRRWKSKGHHTAGFGTREEAIAYVPKLVEDLKDASVGGVATSLDADFPWDGEGIPAMVVFFAVEGDKATALL